VGLTSEAGVELRYLAILTGNLVRVANRISPFICGQRDTTILDERSANRK
jgi:hypothetical protein